MAGSEKKETYFDGREVAPSLVELYFDRLGGPERVLDLGCGRGSFGTEQGVTVVGVDIDLGALETAKHRESVVLGDIESALPFKPEAFDGVIAKDILEHLNRPSPAVTELWRVLKPGGRAVISVPMAKPSVVWGDYTHVRGFTAAAATTMVRDQGFDVVSVTPMGGVPGAGQFGLVRYLPTLLRVPGFRRFATSHEIVVEKPRSSDPYE